ncbi:MAG: UbiA family prenyltransferase [Gloeotrichia echinulata IR180]
MKKLNKLKTSPILEEKKLDSVVDFKSNLKRNIKKWWVYQQERFPVIKNGLLIAVFSSSAVCYSVLLRGGKINFYPLFAAFFVAFTCVFLFFLQLRIADEFKDFADDSLYRAYRPVPRGLISLPELGWLGVMSAIAQLGLSFWLAPSLILPLGAVWLYLGLMSKEFFIAQWLKAHPLIYMLSHMVILPLINLYSTACDWLVAGTIIPVNSFWFLLASFFNGMVIEIGRKIRVPSDEEFGVDTYSAVWGYQKAVKAWLLVLLLTAVTAVCAANQLLFLLPVAALLLVMFACAVGVAWLFIKKPTTRKANAIETMSGLWTLLVYLSLGILPMLLHSPKLQDLR